MAEYMNEKDMNPQSPHLSIPSEVWDALFEAALDAQRHAHAPYSDFPVGAALLTQDGTIVQGCNMENATFGATVCAERTAFGNAISKGFRAFQALCVITSLSPPASPCGICRQVIAEFCDNIPVMVANPSKEHFFTSLDELLPHRFSKKDLD